MTALTDRLAAIAAEIDERLEDEHADRQEIAEDAARRIRQVIRGLSRARDPQPATPAADGTYGPFSDDRAASAASSWAQQGRLQGQMQDLSEQDLLSACGRAGVTLADYDRRIIRWVAGFEPASTSVLAGLITRASAAAVIDSATVRRALADSVAYRRCQLEDCTGCASEPELSRCDACAESLTWLREAEDLLDRMTPAPRVDSRVWRCGGCHGTFIGNVPAAVLLCRFCAPDGAR